MISVLTQSGPAAAVAWVFIIIMAISIHEMAHAWMAQRCGDNTAASMGRVTPNPVAHFDPIGFLCVMFAPIGWGKPVPYNPYNLQDERRDGMWIAWAGPASNFIQAILFAILLQVIFFAPVYSTLYQLPGGTNILIACSMVFQFGVILNVGLAFFNLIPIFPLDGEKILVGLLPFEQARTVENLRQYGTGMLMGLLLINFAVYPVLTPYFMLTAQPIINFLLPF
ncbi:MAG: site-2 protease family protein [Candidatus Hinthialibacter antarcticus]|nr:site-2 protease family protein [Candidatus Hinthialibacter antarcticus]